MWDWLETLGRTALRAAPYVAAPFTGGASLMALPASNAAADAWGRSDVRQGEGQQGFERWASPVSNYAAMIAPYTGGFGLDSGGYISGDGSNRRGGIGPTTRGGVPVGQTGWEGVLNQTGGGGGSSWQNTLNNIMQGTRGGMQGTGYGGFGGGTPGIVAGPGNGTQSYGLGEGTGWQNAIANIIGGFGNGDPGMSRTPQQQTNDPGINFPYTQPWGQDPGMTVMPRGGFSYRNQPLNQYDQSEPNLALALHQGRQEAIMNQPWRGGYTNNWIDRNTAGEPVQMQSRNAPIYPNVQSQRKSERRDSRRVSSNY